MYFLEVSYPSKDRAMAFLLEVVIIDHLFIICLYQCEFMDVHYLIWVIINVHLKDFMVSALAFRNSFTQTQSLLTVAFSALSSMRLLRHPQVNLGAALHLALSLRANL